jgi:hypothetical protein
VAQLRKLISSWAEDFREIQDSVHRHFVSFLAYKVSTLRLQANKQSFESILKIQPKCDWLHFFLDEIPVFTRSCVLRPRKRASNKRRK